MGNYVTITGEITDISTELDGVVIPSCIETKTGGVTLDVSSWTENSIQAGTPIIYNSTTGIYKPMPVTDDKFGTLPEGFEYFGILVATISKAMPFAGVMVRGTVNYAAMPYEATDILSALKTALPLIRFIND